MHRVLVLVLVAFILVGCGGHARPTPEPSPLATPTALPRPSGKGLAGGATSEQMDEMGATWYHHWAPCKNGEAGRGCIDHVKAWWTLQIDSSRYGDIETMKQRLELCESGWFMYGDEYELQGFTLEEQAREWHFFLEMRDEINPSCKAAMGVILAYHPSKERAGYEWVTALAEVYQNQYGELPDIQALVMDSYLWMYSDWEKRTRQMAEAARETYPGVEVWAREIGSLLPEPYPMMACQQLPQITQHLDRWAWFIVQSDGDGAWRDAALYGETGHATALGWAYAAQGQEMPGDLHGWPYRMYFPRLGGGG